jgi:hypothetical protein
LTVFVRWRVTVAVGAEGDDGELDAPAALEPLVPPVWPVIDARLMPVTLQ